jgi:hypothetical protein
MSSGERLEAITTTEEMVSIYEEMLVPIRELTVSIDNLYQPNCIGGMEDLP